jgi:hypothetical protein
MGWAPFFIWVFLFPQLNFLHIIRFLPYWKDLKGTSLSNLEDL